MNYPHKQVYLAGPITGLTHDEARYGWRKQFRNMLRGLNLEHVRCYSPMRGKEFLKDIGVLDANADTYPDNAMSTGAGIVTRDFNDVKNCDVMVACFLESGGRLSGGTFMEYGFAHALHKPVVAIGPPDDPNISHAMAERVAGYRVDTLEEGAHIVGHLLTPAI